jgi:hypothetical protein
MTGTETYRIFGSKLTRDQLRCIYEGCAGLNLYWDCLRKAFIVKQYLGFGVVVAGRCMILSADGSSSYGHYWNPPYEFHAWWQPWFKRGISTDIIDVALPGLILKGSSSQDKIGFMLTGRSPVVLAGPHADWMAYDGAIEVADVDII